MKGILLESNTMSRAQALSNKASFLKVCKWKLMALLTVNSLFNYAF